MVNTKFVDFDAREETRIKNNPNNFPDCVVCQKLIRGEPKFYLCFLKEEFSNFSDCSDGRFPFALHPEQIKSVLQKSKLEFLPIGSDCAKRFGLDWCIKKEDLPNDN